MVLIRRNYQQCRHQSAKLFLAFLGAFIWATYCTVTNKYARGFNGITVFVLLTAVALWFHYFLTPQPAMIFSLPVIAKLFTAALTLGFAYAAWNVGILHGNVTIMAVGLILPRHVLCSGSAVTQLATVILLLARRSHGLRRFATLLAGNAAALIATGGPKSTRCTLTLFITQLRFYLSPVCI